MHNWLVLVAIAKEGHTWNVEGGNKRRTGVKKIRRLMNLAEAIRLEDKRIFEAFKPGDFKEDLGRNVYT